MCEQRCNSLKRHASCETPDSLERCHLLAAEEDTEHQGNEGQQGHAEPEVSHVVLPLGLSQAVGQRWLQTHKEHAGRKGDACSDIVENLGIIHLSCGERRGERGWISSWEKKQEQSINGRQHSLSLELLGFVIHSLNEHLQEGWVTKRGRCVQNTARNQTPPFLCWWQEQRNNTQQSGSGACDCHSRIHTHAQDQTQRAQTKWSEHTVERFNRH